MQITWPDGKRFAFTIFDDTDAARVGNFEAVYDFLHDRGLRTTKSVWPLRSQRETDLDGDTLEDDAYRAEIERLRARGFEIGFHNSCAHERERPDIERGLARFREVVGGDPRTMANHNDSAEAMYWGPARLNGLHRRVYGMLMRGAPRWGYRGHVEGTPYFWGDICRERVSYVRNFVYGDINTLKACPWMPYHDPDRPYVRHWYASSEGKDVESFNRCLSEANQDRLEREGGACIMYTHFAFGFQKDGAVNARFRELLTRLSSKNGWFVPVSTLLDHILKARGPHVLRPGERRRLQNRWFLHKLRTGGTS